MLDAEASDLLSCDLQDVLWAVDGTKSECVPPEVQALEQTLAGASGFANSETLIDAWHVVNGTSRTIGTHVAHTRTPIRMIIGKECV